MKPFYVLCLVIFISLTVNAQTHQCVLMSNDCCTADDEYFELVPIEDRKTRTNGTTVYANQVPLVHYTGNIKKYPLEMRVETNQDVVKASIDYYDYSTFSFKETDLRDDGIGLDKTGGDATYTSTEDIVQSRDIRNSDIIYHYNLIFGTVTLTYASGGTEEFKLKLDGYTIDGDAIQLDTNSLEINREGDFYYSENVVNCVLPQEFSDNQLNFPFRDVGTAFRNTWTRFKDDYLVYTTLVETNAGNINFQTSASAPGKYIINVSSQGMTNALPMHHEINHFWLYPSEFNFVSNHWRYIERPQSGFGYDCYNGVMTEIYEENGVVNYLVEKADNPHDYYFNDIELNLMGVLPVDSVKFPLKYFDRFSATSSDCNRTSKTISDGKIEFLSKEDYVAFKASKDLQDVSDGLNLKFIFFTEERLTREEHALLEYLVLHYADLFKESTSNLVDLNTEIYSLNSSTNNAVPIDNLVSIFPNPTDNFITIEIETDAAAKYTLYDVTGKMCKTDKVPNGRQRVNLNDMPEGLYLLRITSDDGDSWTERIVKE